MLTQASSASGQERRAIQGPSRGRVARPPPCLGLRHTHRTALIRWTRCDRACLGYVVAFEASRPPSRGGGASIGGHRPQGQITAGGRKHRTRAVWNPGASGTRGLWHWASPPGQEGHSEPVAVQTISQPGNVRVVFGGSWWAVAVLFCTTLICLSSAVTAFILYVRPLLLKAERASEKMEKAAEEMEKAALVMNLDLPYALDATERAGLEFEELGRTLNTLSGGLRRAAPAPRPRRPRPAGRDSLGRVGEGRGEGGASPLERELAGRVWERGAEGGPALPAADGVREGASGSAPPLNGYGEDVRVAVTGADTGAVQWTSTAVAWLRALTPAMEGWRTRIGRLARGFELYKQEREAAAQTAAQNEQDARDWIDTWRARQANGQGTPENAVGNGLAVSVSNVVPKPLGAQRGNLAQGLASKVAGTVAKVASALPGSRDADKEGDGSPLPLPNSTASPLTAAHLIGHASPAVVSEAAFYRAEAEAAANQERTGWGNTGDLRRPQGGSGDPPRGPGGPLPNGDVIERFGSLTAAERRLVRKLSDKREAAEAVFTALFHAEKAAAAAAQATGELESALNRAGPNPNGTNPSGQLRGEASVSMTTDEDDVDDDDHDLHVPPRQPGPGIPPLW